MKRNLTMIATVMMMVLSLSSFAKETVNPLKNYTSKSIVLSYVEASTHGNNMFNKHLFTNDFEYVNAVNNTKSSKKDYLKFLDATKELKFDCETSYEVLDQTGNTAVAKTTMKFENFTRVDILSLTQSKDGWKINKVVTSYK